jgi:hypothetical protein
MLVVNYVLLQLKTGARGLVKRLQLLYDFSQLVGQLEGNELVAARLRAMLRELPEGHAPAAWWTPEADLALLLGVYRHGYSNYDAIRSDPALLQGFEVSDMGKAG